MNRTLQRAKVALALLVIFASGIGLGWFTRDAQKPPADPTPPADNQAAAASHWTDHAMTTLTRELHLTADQQRDIRPLLQDASGKLDLDRERALFQLHLQVLKVHDDMRPFLQPDQLHALDRMKARLQDDIKRSFSALLKDPAHPPPDL